MQMWLLVDAKSKKAQTMPILSLNEMESRRNMRKIALFIVDVACFMIMFSLFSASLLILLSTLFLLV